MPMATSSGLPCKWSNHKSENIFGSHSLTLNFCDDINGQLMYKCKNVIEIMRNLGVRCWFHKTNDAYQRATAGNLQLVYLWLCTIYWLICTLIICASFRVFFLSSIWAIIFKSVCLLSSVMEKHVSTKRQSIQPNLSDKALMLWHYLVV